MGFMGGRAARMQRHHKRRKVGGAINLVSMMDIFTILVFFLLVSSGEVEEVPNAKDVRLPDSIAEQRARESVVVLVTEQTVLVQGEPVASVPEIMADEGIVIPELKEALERQSARVLDAAARADAASREVTIMGDREIPYKLLKKIMATCTAADYGALSLAVLQKANDAAVAAAGG